MLTILHGDALTQLKTLEPESVHTCVTSPPYWGLRDYGVEGQIGLESTPEAYVDALVDVFREVRRVLRSDGTLWLNLGDSYTGSGKGGNPDEGKQATNKGSQSIGVLYGKTGETARRAAVTNVSRRACAEHGMKPKDLVGIPWMVAFALRADGWYLRSDIIWSKPNPMPESVTDRPTKSHEYIFLLSKSAKYYYDAEAIKEAPSGNSHGGGRENATRKTWLTHGAASHRGLATAEPSGQDGRNRRSVWTVSTFHFSEAHFATFPPKLIEPCILAGSKAGDVVLDPFAGSGTTGKVAIELGRKAILIEPKAEYVEMIERRCKTTIGLPLTA